MGSEWIRGAQMVEIELLDEFMRLCEQNDLTYYLVGGTLLGAVRHKGFIPWDDDIDVGMPRADYERFKTVAREQLKDIYHLQLTEEEERYPNEAIKVRKKNTAFELKWALRYKPQCTGFWLDIFPLDDVPKQSSRGQAFYGYVIQSLLKRMLNWYFEEDISDKTPRGQCLIRIGRLFPFARLRQFKNRLMQHYNGRDCAYYVNYSSQYGYKKQTMPKDKFNPPCKVAFEGRQCNAPRDTDYVLTRYYGKNYRELPPVEKRRTFQPVRLSYNTEGPDEVL